MRMSFVSILWKLEAFVRDKPPFLSPSRPFLFIQGRLSLPMTHDTANLWYIIPEFLCVQDYKWGGEKKKGGGWGAVVHEKCTCRKHRTGETFTGYICQSQEIIGSRFSVNTSSHSTSRPMRVESITTVGFSIVNISLTRRPASLGDCPAFSPLRWSCCSN